MQRLWREAVLYFLLLTLTALAIAAATFFGFSTSYAGVTDESVVAAGVAAYPDYLRAVARSVAVMGALQVAMIFVVTVGFLPATMDLPGRHSARAVAHPAHVIASRSALAWRIFALFMIAMAAHTTWLGAQARRHPGLFLPVLSAWSGASWWLAISRWLWPVMIGVSLIGWAHVGRRASSFGAKLTAVVGFLAAGAWLVLGEANPARLGDAKPAVSSLPTAEARYPNILLIGVDSLRPDKIDERTTPALARLLRESIYFPRTLVTLPRTAPSWAALLTSMPPLSNGVETMFPTSARSRLAEVAMPAHLASLGYATSVISEYAGESFGRMKFGFQEEVVPRVELEQILGQGLLGRQPVVLGFAGALYTGPPWLQRALPAPLPELMRGLASFSHPPVLARDLARVTSDQSPWFALVFYSQPHFPYTSSSPFFRNELVQNADPALRFGKDVAKGEVRTDADRAEIDVLYRASLAETDAAIGALLGDMEKSGRLDDTLVVLTADHGEGLYECATCVGHGDNLTGMSTLTVPLAFRLPRRRFPTATPRVVDTYVSQLDVYPTVLELVGVPATSLQEGLALLSKDGKLLDLPNERVFFAETGEWLWPTAAVPSPRMTYPPITSLATIEDGRIVIEERFLPVIRAAKHRSAFLPPFKLLYRPAPEGVTWSLFDVDRDPEERRDLSASEPAMTARLRAALRHSVLRHAHMLPEGDYFLTRPEPPPEEYY